MSITRINEFQAQQGQGDALRALIESFVPMIKSSAGCHSCQLLQGLEDTARITVIEAGSCSNFISPPHRGIHNGVFDSWQELRAVTTAPKGAVCARLFMATYKHQAGGEFQTYLDAVRLVPANIFTDGFESGDLGLWSSQSP